MYQCLALGVSRIKQNPETKITDDYETCGTGNKI